MMVRICDGCDGPGVGSVQRMRLHSAVLALVCNDPLLSISTTRQVSVPTLTSQSRQWSFARMRRALESSRYRDNP
jgi:hypothetical protein